jgi:hypothetical protein
MQIHRSIEMLIILNPFVLCKLSRSIFTGFNRRFRYSAGYNKPKQLLREKVQKSGPVAADHVGYWPIHVYSRLRTGPWTSSVMANPHCINHVENCQVTALERVPWFSVSGGPRFESCRRSEKQAWWALQ